MDEGKTEDNIESRTNIFLVFYSVLFHITFHLGSTIPTFE